MDPRTHLNIRGHIVRKDSLRNLSMADTVELLTAFFDVGFNEGIDEGIAELGSLQQSLIG